MLNFILHVILKMAASTELSQQAHFKNCHIILKVVRIPFSAGHIWGETNKYFPNLLNLTCSNFLVYILYNKHNHIGLYGCCSCCWLSAPIFPSQRVDGRHHTRTAVREPVWFGLFLKIELSLPYM